MHQLSFAAALLTSALLVPSLACAQDVVDLHRVTIDVDDNVTVVYSKNFATCAHLRLSDPACASYGPLVHVQNIFCSQGNMVSVTMPATAFTAAFAAGISVFMVHGNNANVRSACLTVTCDGSYGSGCAGAAGTPVLGAVEACPPQGGSLDLTLANGPAGSLAVLGFGLSQTSLPLFGCNLLIGGVQGTVVVAFDGAGAGSFSLPLPLGSAGFEFTAQAFALDVGGPQGFSLTNALLLRVQ